MNETELIDAILRHALELQRLSQHEEAAAEAILRDLETDLRILLNRQDLTAANKRQVAAIIKQAQQAIADKYVNLAGVVDVDGIVQHVAERTVTIMQAGFSANMAAPTIETLRSLSKDILIDGAPSSAWWAKQSEDTAFKFAGVVRRGVLNGATNEQIVRDVAGRGGIMDTSRRNARALVHSSVMTAANRARLETYRKNSKFSSGVKWLATLDSRTCLQCATLDGSQWDFDGKALKGTKQEFQAPPAHMNCRCVLTPLPISFDDLGFEGMDEALAGIGARASSQGPQRSGTTFAEFLKRQSPEFVEDVLGTRRAQLYQSGKITLTDLVTKGGRQKTLEELRTR